MQTTIDRAGRLVIPQALRQALGVPDGGRVDIEEVDGGLVIRPHVVTKHLEDRGGVAVCVPDEPLPTLTADQVRDLLESMRP